VKVLGISAFYHDSAACLVVDGEVVAAAQEERFTRKKHDADFPLHAAAYCLQAGGVGPKELDVVAYYEKPLTSFARLMETYLDSSDPRAYNSFRHAMPAWARQKLWIPAIIAKELKRIGYRCPRVKFLEHHESHAASAFFPSPFQRAAVMTMDGVGEWACTTLAHGIDSTITPIVQQDFPHSAGLFYSAFTYFTGFRVNSGEYKLMGLAPYGEPTYVDKIRDELIDLRPDGSFRLNMKYFDFMTGLKMTNHRFAELFGGPARKPESELTKREMDLARSVQVVLEDIVLKSARFLHMQTGETNLCLAGGVALNCVANGKILANTPFETIWIQPASGDAGGALGVALGAYYAQKGTKRVASPSDSMRGAYLGPTFSSDEVQAFFDGKNVKYTRYSDRAQLAEVMAGHLASEKIVAVARGRMEFGPRALGHRSILGDPRSPRMQRVMNLAVKKRESFRPFAPAVLGERVREYFDLQGESPYMLLTTPVMPGVRKECEPIRDDVRAWVNQERSTIPAVTHVDYSARVQTLTPDRNEFFYDLVKAFEAKTGCPVVINTSFNVRSEPIVCTPADAYRCFMSTEIDVLLVEDCVVLKSEQAALPETEKLDFDKLPLD